MKEYKLYYLICPITNQIRYIGQTQQSLQERLRQHLKDKTISYKTSWLNSLRKEGLKPFIKKIFETNNSDYIDSIESKTIRELLKRGYRLTNLDLGVKTRRGFKQTETAKKLLSEKAKKQDLSIQIAAMKKRNTGLKRTSRECEIIRQRMKGSSMLEETKKKISETLKRKGIRPSIEACKKGGKTRNGK